MRTQWELFLAQGVAVELLKLSEAGEVELAGCLLVVMGQTAVVKELLAMAVREEGFEPEAAAGLLVMEVEEVVVESLRNHCERTS